MHRKLHNSEIINASSAYQMKKLLELLSRKAGSYSGKGIKDEFIKFSANLELIPIVNDHGINIKLKAVDDNNELIDEEHTIITLNNENVLSLWTLNTHFHTMHFYELRDYKRIPNTKDILIFGFGERDSMCDFREELTIELWDNGDLSYNYFWGMPNGEFVSCLNQTLTKNHVK